MHNVCSLTQLFLYVAVGGAQEGQNVYPPPTGYALHHPPSHHHTNSDSQVNQPDGPGFGLGYPTGPNIYENWEPAKSSGDRNRSHSSSSGIGEMADNLGGMKVSSPPPPVKPVGSQASQETTPIMPPFSTNATSQYQTSHQV